MTIEKFRLWIIILLALGLVTVWAEMGMRARTVQRYGAAMRRTAPARQMPTASTRRPATATRTERPTMPKRAPAPATTAKPSAPAK